MWILLLLLVVVGGLVLAGCQATRAGYESAPYTVVRTDGKFELRDYPALTVVETPMTAASGDAADGSFLRLFRFITGGNEGKQKIAMTTPVFMSGGGTNATMAFVLRKWSVKLPFFRDFGRAPAERADANRRSAATGKPRSARIERISSPTMPVAPVTITLNMFQSYEKRVNICPRIS